MDIQEFQRFMLQKDFKVVGNAKSAYGVENGFPVTVSFLTAKSVQATFGVEGGVGNWKQMVKELKGQLKPLGAGATFQNGILNVSMGVKTPDFLTNAYGQIVRTATGFLRQNGVAPPQTCPICKQPGCDILIPYQGSYRPAHSRCLEQIIEDAQSQARNNERNGSYVTGIIGGILGMIVGAVPSILSIVMVEKIYAVLFALIPICIYFGYKLLRGKQNRVALAITLVLSFVDVYLIEIALLLIAMMGEFGFTLSKSLALAGQLLAESGAWIAMTQDSILSFLFVGLGVWFSWGYITRTVGTVVRDAESVRQAVLPNSGQEVS